MLADGQVGNVDRGQIGLVSFRFRVWLYGLKDEGKVVSMEKGAIQSVNHQFVIRVWQETQCRKPAEWRIRIHHVNSGNVFFSTDIDQAFEQMKVTIGLTENVAC